MSDIKDRRSFDRLTDPQMAAFMISSGWYYFLKFKLLHRVVIYILGKNLIQNFSASGTCIIGNNTFEPGKLIYFILYSPGKKILLIKGTVRWISTDFSNNKYYTGIQFLAYGKGKRYNSFHVLEQLRIYSIEHTIPVE